MIKIILSSANMGDEATEADSDNEDDERAGWWPGGRLAFVEAAMVAFMCDRKRSSARVWVWACWLEPRASSSSASSPPP